MPRGSKSALGQGETEQLAKQWLLRLIERTPLAQAGDIPVAWIAGEAPPLIAEIVAALSDPSGEITDEVDAAARERFGELANLHQGPGAAERIPRDLAALQKLLVDAIRLRDADRGTVDFARDIERLAEVFGSIQSAVAARLVDERTGGAATDELTGLPGPVQLDEWLALLLADQQRYDQGFALALLDIDGLGKINDAYGREAGDRLLTALAGVLKRQIGAADRAFRLGDDEFCIVAPRQSAEEIVPIVERIAALIADSQSADDPRIAVAAGVAASPADGPTRDELLAAAEQATYAAKAAGQPVAVSPGGSPTVMQDR